MDNQCCFRGDMFYANLSPFTGSEQGGYRPVIIVQNDSGNKFSPTVIVCAVTSKGMTKAHLPVHVPLPEKFGLEPNSIALLEQIRTIDKRRLDGYIGRLDDDIMQQIDEALAISVNLKKKEYDNGMLICLCGNCANVFYNSSEHKIHRADMDQTIKEPCTICSHHKGYDYIVQQKVKTHKGG